MIRVSMGMDMFVVSLVVAGVVGWVVCWTTLFRKRDGL